MSYVYLAILENCSQYESGQFCFEPPDVHPEN